MHTTMLLLLFVLFVDGVSGADPDETLSVMEGDSVPLHTDLTEILNDHTILWKFGPKGSFISQITRKDNYTSFHYTDDVRFRGRLQVDQNTGSLTIRNTRERHSGQYQVAISRGRAKLPSKTFNVTVQRVASGSGGVKSVSVMEGEPVTLNPDPTQIHGDDLVLWRFGEIHLAKIDVENKQISLNDADEIFRGRLQLDQTGSLTITNTRTTDSGLYHLQIKGRESSQQFFLTVSQPGLSSGAVAGIVVAVLLVLAAAAAAAAVVVFYYRRKISELRKQIWRYVSVTEGESVHLFTDRPKIERDDVIQWRLGDEIIAEIKGGTGETHDGADGRFRDRLQLDKRTGDLTIKSSTAEDAGLYNLKIISSKGNTDRAYRVIITVRDVFVTEGDSIHLSTGRPKIERDDVIQWMFGGEIIAEIKGGTGKTHDGPDERFRDRLQLNDQTGDLTIKNSTAEDTGLYKLKIRSSKGDTNRTYSVFITVSRVFVTEGESVHLSTGRPKIERDDVIQWRFGDEIIAEIKGGTGETHDGADVRFRDRLQLDKITGDLTIKSSTDEDAGRYKLKIINSKGNTNRAYRVIITVRDVFVTEGESVHLSTDRPKIERDDEIQWRFGDEIIAEIKGGTGKTHDDRAEGRFRDRLELDKRTGDLTIKSSTAEDTGLYNLKIISSKGNKNKTYSVIIRVRKESPVKGNNDESVVEMQPLMIK